MIESTAIYCFVVSMILIFANPFTNLAVVTATVREADPMQIDWLTVAAQIVNFLSFSSGCCSGFYRPITQAMARREERIQTRLSEAKVAREEVEAETGRLREQQQAPEVTGKRC